MSCRDGLNGSKDNMKECTSNLENYTKDYSINEEYFSNESCRNPLIFNNTLDSANESTSGLDSFILKNFPGVDQQMVSESESSSSLLHVTKTSDISSNLTYENNIIADGFNILDLKCFDNTRITGSGKTIYPNSQPIVQNSELFLDAERFAGGIGEKSYYRDDLDFDKAFTEPNSRYKTASQNPDGIFHKCNKDFLLETNLGSHHQPISPINLQYVGPCKIAQNSNSKSMHELSNITELSQSPTHIKDWSDISKSSEFLNIPNKGNADSFIDYNLIRSGTVTPIIFENKSVPVSEMSHKYKNYPVQSNARKSLPNMHILERNKSISMANLNLSKKSDYSHIQSKVKEYRSNMKRNHSKSLSTLAQTSTQMPVSNLDHYRQNLNISAIGESSSDRNKFILDILDSIKSQLMETNVDPVILNSLFDLIKGSESSIQMEKTINNLQICYNTLLLKYSDAQSTIDDLRLYKAMFESDKTNVKSGSTKKLMKKAFSTSNLYHNLEDPIINKENLKDIQKTKIAASMYDIMQCKNSSPSSVAGTPKNSKLDAISIDNTIEKPSNWVSKANILQELLKNYALLESNSALSDMERGNVWESINSLYYELLSTIKSIETINNESRDNRIVKFKEIDKGINFLLNKFPKLQLLDQNDLRKYNKFNQSNVIQKCIYPEEIKIRTSSEDYADSCKIKMYIHQNELGKEEGLLPNLSDIDSLKSRHCGNNKYDLDNPEAAQKTKQWNFEFSNFGDPILRDSTNISSQPSFIASSHSSMPSGLDLVNLSEKISTKPISNSFSCESGRVAPGQIKYHDMDSGCPPSEPSARNSICQSTENFDSAIDINLSTREHVSQNIDNLLANQNSSSMKNSINSSICSSKARAKLFLVDKSQHQNEMEFCSKKYSLDPIPAGINYCESSSSENEIVNIRMKQKRSPKRRKVAKGLLCHPFNNDPTDLIIASKKTKCSKYDKYESKYISGYKSDASESSMSSYHSHNSAYFISKLEKNTEILNDSISNLKYKGFNKSKSLNYLPSKRSIPLKAQRKNDFRSMGIGEEIESSEDSFFDECKEANGKIDLSLDQSYDSFSCNHIKEALCNDNHDRYRCSSFSTSTPAGVERKRSKNSPCILSLNSIILDCHHSISSPSPCVNCNHGSVEQRCPNDRKSHNEEEFLCFTPITKRKSRSAINLNKLATHANLDETLALAEKTLSRSQQALRCIQKGFQENI